MYSGVHTVPPGAAPQRSYIEGPGGASGGDYYDALQPFLGPLTKAVIFLLDSGIYIFICRCGQVDHQASDNFPHEAYFLPDAYQGRNDYIRETLVQVIAPGYYAHDRERLRQLVVNYNSFITSEILPCESAFVSASESRPTGRQQQNPGIAWDSITFDKTLVDMEPEQVPLIRSPAGLF